VNICSQCGALICERHVRWYRDSWLCARCERGERLDLMAARARAKKATREPRPPDRDGFIAVPSIAEEISAMTFEAWCKGNEYDPQSRTYGEGGDAYKCPRHT